MSGNPGWQPAHDFVSFPRAAECLSWSKSATGNEKWTKDFGGEILILRTVSVSISEALDADVKGIIRVAVRDISRGSKKRQVLFMKYPFPARFLFNSITIQCAINNMDVHGTSSQERLANG